MKVFVLGGNGFIGKNIVEYFTDKKEYQIFAPSREELNLLELSSLEAYIQQHSFDIVIHSAVNIHSLEENCQLYFNIEKLSHLYKKLITIGSGAEYDLRHYIPKMREEYFGTYIPADTYGLSKFIASKDIELNGKNSVNLRVFGIFGKYEDYSRRFISNNIARALCSYDITLFKNMKFDYIYIHDFLKILEIFMTHDTEYKNYNICNTEAIELLELAKIIYSIHGDKNLKIVAKESGMKDEYSGDNSRFLKEFTPSFQFTPFNDAIKELYDYYSTLDLQEFSKSLQSS